MSISKPKSTKQTVGIHPAAVFVLVDEKAYGLIELNLLKPDYTSLRRYQIVLVNRGDKLAEAAMDLGPAENFLGVVEFNIPSLWEHTVGELRDIADTLRDTSSRTREIMLTDSQNRDIIKEAHDLQEAKSKKERII